MIGRKSLRRVIHHLDEIGSEIAGFRTSSRPPPGEDRGAAQPLAGVWGGSWTPQRNNHQQSCNNHLAKKNKIHPPLAPLRRDVVLIYRLVWSSFTGRSILLKVVVCDTSWCLQRAMECLIPRRLLTRNDRYGCWVDDNLSPLLSA